MFLCEFKLIFCFTYLLHTHTFMYVHTHANAHKCTCVPPVSLRFAPRMAFHLVLRQRSEHHLCEQVLPHHLDPGNQTQVASRGVQKTVKLQTFSHYADGATRLDRLFFSALHGDASYNHDSPWIQAISLPRGLTFFFSVVPSDIGLANRLLS